MNGTSPTIAMVGCGAIAQRYHLPALATNRSVIESAILVDPDRARAARLAEQFGIRRMAVDIDEVMGELDGAIVAVPPAFHHPVCLELLEHGVHVLCEKPLADSWARASEMVDRAAQRGVALCVNHTRRLYPSYAEVRRLIADGAIGAPNTLRYDEGFEFDWPAASAFHFRNGPRGVLLDTGIHGLDTICWWLAGAPTLVSSENDSFGGPEAMARVRMRYDSCWAELRLSWLNRLANQYTITGERGCIVGRIDAWDRVRIEYKNGQRQSLRLRGCERSYAQFGERIVRNFLDVIGGRAAPLVPARDVLPAIELMDQAYRDAKRLPLPWLQPHEVCHA